MALDYVAPVPLGSDVRQSRDVQLGRVISTPHAGGNLQPARVIKAPARPVHPTPERPGQTRRGPPRPGPSMFGGGGPVGPIRALRAVFLHIDSYVFLDRVRLEMRTQPISLEHWIRGNGGESNDDADYTGDHPSGET